VLLLQRGEDDVLYEAAAMAAAATSLGIAVTLVWFGGALEALVSGRLSEEDDSRAGGLLASARETGLLRSLACSAALVNRKLPIENVREKVDDIVGWPTAISLIRAAGKSFVW
jgi:predicted peroxiredoxin